MLEEPLQHSARHEIKDFHGALLSSRPIPALLIRHARRVRKFETNLRRERQLEGIADAKARGV
jgi:hypothetical protein